MNKEFKTLQKEEDKIYLKLIDLVENKKINKFCKLLNEYVDVQLELEKECGK